MVRLLGAVLAMCLIGFQPAVAQDDRDYMWGGYGLYGLLGHDTIFLRFVDPHPFAQGVMLGPDPSNYCYEKENLIYVNTFQELRQGFTRNVTGALYIGTGDCGNDEYVILCLDMTDVPQESGDFDMCASARVLEWDPDIIQFLQMPTR